MADEDYIFNGSDYNPALDNKRLLKQHERIIDLMKDNKWRTLSEIKKATGDPEASISAQLRHLRKRKFGSNVLNKRRRGKPEDGLFEYQLIMIRQFFQNPVIQSKLFSDVRMCSGENSETNSSHQP